MLLFYKNSKSSDKVMIVTQEECASQLLQRIQKDKAWNYQITAISVMDANLVGKEIEGIPVVANADTIFDVATQMILDEVFIYLPDASKTAIKEIIMDFEAMGITCHYNVEMEELDLAGKTAGKFAGFAVMMMWLYYTSI